MKAREVKRAKCVAKYAEKRAALNAALLSAYFATHLALFTSRAFIDSFAMSYF